MGLTALSIAQGEVALSIADDAYKVAFYISFDNGESNFTKNRLPEPHIAC